MALTIILAFLPLTTSADDLHFVETFKGFGPTSDNGFGWNITSGDLNGDGISDICVGAPFDDIGGAQAGAVYIFYGPSLLGIRLNASKANATLIGPTAGGNFGWDLTCDGDLDGDGLVDLLVGAPGSSNAYIYLANSNYTGITNDSFANVTLSGNSTDLFGHSVAMVSDLDTTTTGFDDIVIGAPLNDTYDTRTHIIRDTGATFVFFNDGTLPSTINALSADWAIRGWNASERYGHLVRNLGDVNADGADDLGVGYPHYNETRGAAHVLLGGDLIITEDFESYPGNEPGAPWVCDDNEINRFITVVNEDHHGRTGQCLNISDFSTSDDTQLEYYPPFQLRGKFVCEMSLKFNETGLFRVEFQHDAQNHEGVNLRWTGGGDLRYRDDRQNINFLEYQPDLWYSFRIIFDTDVGICSVYAWDETQTCPSIPQINELSFKDPVDFIDRVVFDTGGSSNTITEIWMDDFRIYNVSIKEGEEQGDLYGWSVDQAGDINDDGVDDVIIGVPGGEAGVGRGDVYCGLPRQLGWEVDFDEDFEVNMNNWRPTNWTRAVTQVSLGAYAINSTSSTSGNLTTNDIDLSRMEEAYLTFWLYKSGIESNDIGLYFWNGTSYDFIMSLDVYGDAWDGDWLHYPNLPIDLSTYAIEDFRIMIFTDLESNEYISIDEFRVTAFSRSVNITGDETGSGFGVAVRGCGDVDGNGIDDLVVGSPYYENATGIGNGAAFVYLSNGTMLMDQSPSTADHVLYGTGLNGFGAAVGGAGVFNDLGKDELLVGAPTGNEAMTYSLLPFADHIEYVSGDGQSVVVDKDAPIPIKFKVVNATGATVPLIDVDFTVVTTPPSAVGHHFLRSGGTTDTMYTNNKGEAYTEFHLGDKVGVYLINVSVTGLPGLFGETFNNTIDITGLTDVLDTIVLTPSYDIGSPREIIVGNSFSDYSALGYDEFGNLDGSWSPVWGSSDGLGAAVAVGGDAVSGYTGRYTAGASPGYDNITVSDTSWTVTSESAFIIVGLPPALAWIDLTPLDEATDPAVVSAGHTITGYKAIGYDSDGDKNLTWSPVWETVKGLGSAVSQGGDANTGFLANFDAGPLVGIDNITVKDAATSLITNRSAVQIVPDVLDRISLEPSKEFPEATKVIVGLGTSPFTARGYDQYGNLNHSWTPTWGVEGGLGTIASPGGTAGSGFVASFQAGVMSGYDNISVASGDVSNKTCVKIIPGGASTIGISPSEVELIVNTTQKFTLTLRDGYNNPVEPVGTVWTTDAGDLMTTTGSTAMLRTSTAKGNGLFVKAEVGSMSVQATVDLIADELRYIFVTPDEASVPTGLTQRYEVRGIDAYSNPVELVGIEWSATAGTISGNDTGAIFTAGDDPTTGTIEASVGGISGGVSVNVVAYRAPPVIKDGIQNIQLQEDDEPFTLVLDGLGTDDHDKVKILVWFIEWKGDLPYTIEGNFSSEITISPKPNRFGDTQVTLWLRDRDQMTDSQPLWINITPVNDAPVLVQVPQIVMQPGEYSYDLTPFVSDIEEDDLTVSVVGDTGDLEVEVDGLTLKFTGDADTEANFTISVSDGTDETEGYVNVVVQGEGGGTTTDTTGTLVFAILFILIGLVLVILVIVFLVVYLRGFYHIEATYLVSEDGRLIQYMDDTGEEGTGDEEILSGMFTAIQDLLEDAFSEGTADMKGKRLEFGGKNIIFMRGEHVYLILIVKGRPGKLIESKMSNSLKAIEKQYPQFADWDGHRSDLDELDKHLGHFITVKKNNKSEAEAVMENTSAEEP